MRRPVRPFTVEHKRGARQGSVSDSPSFDTPAPMPTPMPEPARYSAPEPTRWAAAEALFSIPPADAPQAVIGSEPASLRRILPSLNEPAAPAYEFEEAPKRRGRKPGSRNKTSRTIREEHGSKAINSVSRNVYELWAQDGEAEDAHAAEVVPLPETSAVESYAADINVTPLALSRRGRLVRADLPRALRWQARLPHFAR